jgi:hypothetical protein
MRVLVEIGNLLLKPIKLARVIRVHQSSVFASRNTQPAIASQSDASILLVAEQHDAAVRVRADDL